jgi:hypothetical protein
MSIRIGKAEFSRHEFVLLILCLAFFALIFFGSFKFKTIGKIFPLLVGGPGFFMVLLYLFSGLFSPRLHDVMKKGTDFRLFGLMPEEDELLSTHSGQGSGARAKPQFRIQLSYLLLALFAGYVLVSFLFGFYVSTFVFTCAYLFIFARSDSQNRPSIIASLFLLSILMSAVSIFDYSFGYDFMEGAVYKLLE